MRESLLVLSDVHLGSDLNDSGSSWPRSKAVDDDLAALFAHYRKAPPSGADRWRLVLAGDFVDFVGMSIDQRKSDELATQPTETERAFGLGGAEDHARLKLRRAVERHPNVFKELAAFVAEGNTVTMIQGNHDLELHWDAVQRDFEKLLGGTIDFQPWFFHREGLVFIEHGHQYDPFCAIPYLYAPLSPRDPKRVQPSLSDCLLRYIVRRTPGMKEYGHEGRGLMSYVTWAFGLGLRGTGSLLMRFIRCIRMLFDTAKGYATDTVLRGEHERAIAKLAETHERSNLEAALKLHVPSLGMTPRGVLASVMLDRLFAGMFFVSLIGLAVALAGAYWQVAVGVIFVLWAIAHVLLSRGRPNVDPAKVMSERSAELARLFPCSFVVMGHTHVPVREAKGEATYFNLGSWAEEEPEETAKNPYRAARTHLVIHPAGEANLFEWRGDGPAIRA